MICPIMHFPGFMTEWYTYACKSIGVLSTSSSSCLEQLLWMIVPWKSGSHSALFTTIELNPRCMPLSFFSSWLARLLFLLLVIITFAFCALGLVTPGKEVFFKPLQQRLELLNLICFVENWIWDTWSGNCFCQFIVPNKRCFHTRFNSEHKLLFGQHISLDFICCNGRKLSLHKIHTLLSIFLSLKSFIETLFLAATYHKLALALVWKIIQLFLFANCTSIFATSLSTNLTDEASLIIVRDLLQFFASHKTVIAVAKELLSCECCLSSFGGWFH